MKFGIMFANVAKSVFSQGGAKESSEAESATRLARAAEESGFESLWAVEHVVVPAGYQSRYPYDPSGRMPGGREDFDIPDPLVWLAYAAAVTKTIKLATGILILPQRNPIITAKEVATLDRLSDGRTLLGVGVGWLEEEFRALGVPFAKRGERTDEYIAALRALWSEECPSYRGKTVQFERVYSRPQPVRGSVPIIIGGHTESAARRAGRLGDGFFPVRGTVDELRALFELARSEARAAGRNPDALELTTGGGDVDHLKRLADLGVSRVVVPPQPPDQLKKFGDDVIAKL
jgi:probable F420-dependent oxidoreductase